VKIFFITVLLAPCIFCLSAQQPVPPVGYWRDHLPYKSAIDVEAGTGKIYCATPYSLFSIATSDQSIERLSRTSGLSETGISVIHYNKTDEKLLIAYTNSNLDIIYRNDVINIPDLKRDNLPGDKSIYNVYSLPGTYYLSTGLGIVVVDGQRYEVKESWMIGVSGAQVKVNGLTTDNGFFYAATEEGLKKGSKSNNLADYHNWQLLSGANGLADGSCQNVVTVLDKVIVQKSDSLFILNGSAWQLFFHDGWPIISTTSTENKISLCQRKPGGEAKVTVLNSDGIIEKTFVQPSFISSPRKAIIEQGNTWIADQTGGLLLANAASFEQFQPDSPEGIATGEMVVDDNVLFAAAGTVDASWTPQGNTLGVYIFKGEDWTTINGRHHSQIDSLNDYISVAAGPTDESVWIGSFGGGLLHMKTDQSFEIFKQNLLAPAVNDPLSYRVSGLAFDAEHNLWISNYGATHPLLVRKDDGTNVRFSIPFQVPENGLNQIVIDDNNYKWIVAAKGGGLICFDHGASVESTGDDRWKRYGSGIGNGNLPVDDVRSVAIDKNGFIWVGTANGIGVIQCTQDVFAAQGCEAVLPIVQHGNFSGYLFSGEEVNSIAVDGADRKWVATKNGAWLLSATGEKVIYQFTEENSPLLSNDVRKIAIDGRSGEVYFATSKGICSFRSTATEGGSKNENVVVFPNPVPPGYSGTIGIKGLVNNAIVKITEMNGRLVYQTRAAGGQAVWDGKDYKGRKISTGVYLVLVSNDERTEKTAARIVFINK